MELLAEIIGSIFVEIISHSREKRKAAKIYRKVILCQNKGRKMKSSDLTAYIGSEVKIFDALGKVSKGILENVTDSSVTLKEEFTKTIFALQFIAKVVVN